MKHCHDSSYDPDMMMDEMYGCGCKPQKPMYPMHPMMMHQMPCHYPMKPMHEMPCHHPMMGMPMEEMPMMPEMMMPEMMEGMYNMYDYNCGCMPPQPMYPMHPMMHQMPCHYPMMPMEEMPEMCEMYPEHYPVAGLEDYYEDEYPECENYDTFVDALNEQYPDLCEETKCLLKELMEIDFTILELHLYLDTHPDDREALARHNQYVCKRKPIVAKLEKLYGPLTPMTKAGYPWTWLNQPWPWRIEY